MKKILSMAIMALFLMTTAALAGKSDHKFNPYDDRYKYETQQMREAGKVKAVFVVFDENRNQVMKDLTLVYRTEAGIKEIAAGADGRMVIVFDRSNYFQVFRLKTAGVEYDVVGDTYEDYDAKDIRKGDVDFYALELNTKNKVAHAYDAD